MSSLTYLLLGFICAALGGEAFVRGCIQSALRFRIPTAIIGVTVAAFATSSPELSVAVNAALAGAPQIAVGNVFGGNIVNVAVVLGLVLCFGPLHTARATIRRDWMLAVMAPLVVLFLAADDRISRGEASILIALFCIWLIVLVRTVPGMHAGAPLHGDSGKAKMAPLFFYLAVGLALLVGAGLFIVKGAESIGAYWGLSPLITGITLVAVGTSMPELATSLVARWRGHDDIGIGTVIGSNIFNLLCIIGVAGVLHPVVLPMRELLPSTFVGLLSLILIFPNAQGIIPRWRAVPLLSLYVVHVLVAVL